MRRRTTVEPVPDRLARFRVADWYTEALDPPVPEHWPGTARQWHELHSYNRYYLAKYGRPGIRF